MVFQVEDTDVSEDNYADSVTYVSLGSKKPNRYHSSGLSKCLLKYINHYPVGISSYIIMRGGMCMPLLANK